MRFLRDHALGLFAGAAFVSAAVISGLSYHKGGEAKAAEYEVLQRTIPISAKPKGWLVIMNYKGDEFVMDSGMTMGDCFEALPKNQVYKGLSFACEKGAE